MKRNGTEYQVGLRCAGRASDTAELRTMLDVLGIDTAAATPHRAVRVPGYEWKALGDVAKGAGTDRAKLINQFIRWYLGNPGAELPGRPCDRRAAAS